MKRLITLCATVLAFQAVSYAGTITRPNTYTSGDVIRSADVTANETTIYDEFNGNINDANILDDSLTAASLAASAVGNSELGASAVTLDKISGAGSTKGMVLKSTGPAANPVWNFSGLTLQYKQATTLTSSSSVSGTFVPTVSTTTIILISTNSVVEISATGTIGLANGTATCYASIYRDTTNLAGTTNPLVSYLMAEAGQHDVPAHVEFIDVGPFTAGVAYAYHVRIRNSNGTSTCRWGDGNNLNHIRVKEISIAE